MGSCHFLFGARCYITFPISIQIRWKIRFAAVPFLVVLSLDHFVNCNPKYQTSLATNSLQFLWQQSQVYIECENSLVKLNPGPATETYTRILTPEGIKHREHLFACAECTRRYIGMCRACLFASGWVRALAIGISRMSRSKPVGTSGTIWRLSPLAWR